MLTASNAFLTLAGVGKSYGSGASAVHALRDVDLQVNRRELTVVLGPSGSGKSTLLNLLGGMDSPTTGSIMRTSFDGEGGEQREEVSSLDDAALTLYRRRYVGFVFQFYNLVSNLTAFENVALAASLVTDRTTAETAAGRALDGVGLGHRYHNFPSQLSGGEMQRVAIARALAKAPAMLLCDEPTGALDSHTGIQVMTLLQEAARSTDTAVIVVTHNPSFAAAADHLLRLQDGRVIESTRVESPLAVAEID